MGKDSGTLTVTADGANSITVTRMDMTTGGEIAANVDGTGYQISKFTGSSMLKIDGKQGEDVTSVFLLVSRDETPPVLTLADPVFFADQETGEYTTTGTADGLFAHDATCTRAQGMTFLFRASKASADGAPAFSDVAADAYYAEAVKWATDNGITNGTTDTTFSPGSGCTRAQIVTFLWRLYAEK